MVVHEFLVDHKINIFTDLQIENDNELQVKIKSLTKY